MAELLLQVTQMSNGSVQHTPLPSILRQKNILNQTVSFPVLFHFGNTLSKPSMFDLCLTIVHNEEANTPHYQIAAPSHLFDQTTIEQLSQRFHLLSQQLLSFDAPRKPIYKFSIILPNEQYLLTLFHNRHDDDDDSISTTVPQLFLEQVMKYPHKVALTLDDFSLTYSQLLARVKQLCHTLKREYDIQIGDIICQCMDRSIEMIVGILTIMMLGGVYVPLNPSDSAARLQSLIRQIRPKLVLTASSSITHEVDTHCVSLSLNELGDGEDDILSIGNDSISHIIFTSGSTGTPKGVQIRHHNFVSCMRTHQFDERDVVLQLAGCSFDVHFDEIVSSLCRGAHLVSLRSGTLSGEKWRTIR